MALQKWDSCDKRASSRLHECDSKFLEVLLLPFAFIFNSFGIVLPGVLLYFIAAHFSFSQWRQGLKWFLTWLLFVLVTLLITTITKRLFNRNRPKAYTVVRMCNLRKTETNKSMPSGDTAQATLYVLFLFYHLGVHWSVLFLAPCVAIARVFYHCHWLGDTLGGALAGSLSFALSVLSVWSIGY